jgi:hypothetical protein
VVLGLAESFPHVPLDDVWTAVIVNKGSRVEAAASLLEFEVGSDGRWTFHEGSWQTGGRRQHSRLLRPTVRGIARATRPGFEAAIATLVRDVELVCAERIAQDGGNQPGGDGSFVAPGQSIHELLDAAFPELAPIDIEALRRAATPVDVGAGTTLMVRGTAGREAMFLLGGRVAVEVDDAIVVLGPGSVVGERAPLTGQPRDATVRALTDVVLLVIGADAMVDLPAGVRQTLESKVRV